MYEYIETDPDTLAQNEADERAACEAAEAHDALINNPIYIAGISEGLRRAAMMQSEVTKQIFDRCTRKPEPNKHYSVMLNNQEAF